MIFLKKYYVNTTPEVDVLSLIHDIRYAIRDSKATEGLVTVTVPAPAAGVVILEALPELMEQLKTALTIFPGEGIEALTRRKEAVAVGPRIKGAMLGRSLTLPLTHGELVLAPREEVMLVDFETIVQRREFVVQVMSEAPPEAKPAAGAPGRRPPPGGRG